MDDIENEDDDVYVDTNKEYDRANLVITTACDNTDDEIEGTAVDNSTKPTYSYLIEDNITIEIDPADKFCLMQAKKEIPIVLDRIMKFIPPSYDQNYSVTPNDFFNAWFGESLLMSMFSWIKRSIPDINIVDIMHFIKIELLLQIYHCSPTQFFDTKMINRYGHQYNKQKMDLRKFRAIMNALCSTPTHSCLEGTWTEPFCQNKKMDSISEHFRRSIAEIAFVPGITMVAIDDDLLRLRSRAVAESGYTQIHNPAKGMGVNHHGAVSVATCLYLSGHVQARNETTLDCVTIIQRSLCGTSVDSNIDLKGSILLMDRGYGGPNGLIHQKSIANKCNHVGTSKKAFTNPFCHGNSRKGNNQKHIQQDGTQAANWAQRKMDNGYFHYHLAWRNGLSRVVLMQTTVKDFGPGKFSFIPIDNKVHDQHIARSHENVIRFEENIIRLTMTQRCPEWFIMRQFRVTGTGAIQMWRYASSKSFTETNESIEQVLFWLDMPRHTPDDFGPDESDDNISDEEDGNGNSNQIKTMDSNDADGCNSTADNNNVPNTKECQRSESDEDEASDNDTNGPDVDDTIGCDRFDGDGCNNTADNNNVPNTKECQHSDSDEDEAGDDDTKGPDEDDAIGRDGDGDNESVDTATLIKHITNGPNTLARYDEKQLKKMKKPELITIGNILGIETRKCFTKDLIIQILAIQDGAYNDTTISHTNDSTSTERITTNQNITDGINDNIIDTTTNALPIYDELTLVRMRKSELVSIGNILGINRKNVRQRN